MSRPLTFTFVFRILRVCHVVFFKQVSCWLLHGSLQDEYNEFFVTRAAESDLPSPTVADLSATDDLDVGGVTGRQLNLIMASTVHCFHLFFVL